MGEPVDRLVVEPQVQDRVHHARHRRRGTGTYRHEKRRFAVTEPLASDAFQSAHGVFDLRPQVVRNATVGQVLDADRRRDREAWRHGNTDVRHLAEVGALATQQMLHRRAPLGGAVPEEVDIPHGQTVMTRLGVRFSRCDESTGSRVG